jgi:uncharacterized membrane protein
MSTYEFLLFAHLLFVVTWVGTDIGIQFLSVRASSSGPQRTVDFTADIEWLGTRLLIPASLLVVVFGVLLVNNVGFDFGDTWVILGLLGFLFSAGVGSAFLGPESGRISKLAGETSPESPEVQARIRRVLLISRIELLILVLVILDMVVKPGL